MMQRRAFIKLLGLAGAAWPVALSAQRVGQVRRIGVLMPFRQSDPIAQRFLDALAIGLRELGWSEGKNIAFEMRYSEGNPQRLPALAADLVQAKVDVLVV